jgi:transcription factor MBP1
VSLRQLALEDSANGLEPVAAPRVTDDYDNISAQLNDDESMADDVTVASASFMGDDDRYDASVQSTGHRKRKREEQAQQSIDQAHMVYSDELLDFFMLTTQAAAITPKPEPPPNYQPDWIIDNEAHTALHWASAMGDVEIMKQLKRFGATLNQPNVKGETPLMRAVLFTNCLDKQSMPSVVKELITTVDSVDYCGATALHHAAASTALRQKHHCARYYLDIIINKMQEVLEPDHVRRILDAQDMNGNTAVHLAAKNKARKCVRALIGRGAATDIVNHEGGTLCSCIVLSFRTRISPPPIFP